MDIIHGQAVEASENVKEGNEQVRGVSRSCLRLAMFHVHVKSLHDTLL